MEPVFNAIAPGRAYGADVTFQPGARTAWHAHPAGQTLIVANGVGRVQQWGSPIDEIRVGDVVRIPPGVKHWHGASPDAAMTHLEITEPIDGRATDFTFAASAANQPVPSTSEIASRLGIMSGDGTSCVSTRVPSGQRNAQQRRLSADDGRLLLAGRLIPVSAVRQLLSEAKKDPMTN